MNRLLMKAVLSNGPENMDQRFALLAISCYARPDGAARVPVRVLMKNMSADSFRVTGLLRDLREGGWFRRESMPDGAPVYHLNLDKLSVPLPVVHVRRAIGSVLDKGPACETCGAPLTAAPQAMETQA